jgi:hypothetical protein
LLKVSAAGHDTGIENRGEQNFHQINDYLNLKGRIEVTRRRGRRRKQLLDDLGDRRGYSHVKEEALDRIKWRNRFGRGCGPVI